MIQIFLYSAEESITDSMDYRSHFVPDVGGYVRWGGEEHRVIKRVARAGSSAVDIIVRRENNQP